MANQNNGSSMFVVAIAIACVLALLGQFLPNNTTPTTTTTSSTPDRSSVEYRYVKGRFQREGYSQSDAQMAADAVIRFHEAQQNRKNR